MRISKSNRPIARSLGAALGLSFGLALTACNQGAEPVAPAAPEGKPSATAPLSMVREISALKQNETDPAKLDAAYNAILTRYGYPVQEPVGPGADLGPVEEGDPLAKAAAVISWNGVKSADFGYNYIYRRTVTMPAGYHMFITAHAIAAPTDPMMVAFYRTAGTAKAYTSKIVAFNDDKDGTTRDAFIEWTNNTGSTKVLEVFAFAYGPSQTGSMQMSGIEPSSILPFIATKTVKAWAIRTHTNPGTFQGCTGPYASRLWLRRKTGGGLQSGVFAVNWSAKRGGYLQEEGTADRTLALEDILPNGGSGNLIVPFMLGAGTTNPATLFNAQQQDRYSCTIAPF